MDLLQFISQFFIFIVIGVVFLYTMIRQKGGAQGQRRPSHMPPFGGGSPSGRPIHEWNRPLEQGQERESLSPPAPVRPIASADMGEEEAPAASTFQEYRSSGRTGAQAGSVRGQSPMGHKSQPASPAAPLSPTAPFLSAQPTAHTVAEGIIWAEILGPPRARKPYRR